MSFPLSMHFNVVHRLQSSPFFLSQPADDAGATGVRRAASEKRDCFAVCVVQHFLTPILIYPDGWLLRTARAARICRIKNTPLYCIQITVLLRREPENLNQNGDYTFLDWHFAITEMRPFLQIRGFPTFEPMM